MMPMKKLLLLSLVLLCSLTAWTAQRSPEEALSIAELSLYSHLRL